MNNPFTEYLALLERMRTELETLSQPAKQKTAAVRQNDLIALDDVLKREQAASLDFRGLEQKQAPLLNATGLTVVPLSALAENFPPKMRPQAKQTVEKLQAQYWGYRSLSEVARTTLECNLHEIDKILDQADQVETPPAISPRSRRSPVP